MSTEGFDTNNNESTPEEVEKGMHHEGGVENSDVLAAFAEAEEGMTPIPHTIEVEDTEALAKLVGIPPDALEQFRVDNSRE